MSVSNSVSTPSVKRVAVPATLLIVANILLMYLVAATPLASVNQYLFSVPILGVLIYGVMIAVGEHISKKALKRGETGLSIAGIAVLQIAYGLFGGGVLAFAPRDLQLPALIVTLIITTAMTLALIAYIYIRDANLSHWNKWSGWTFMGGMLLALIGSFLEPVIMGAFVLFLLGFILELGWEIWKVRAEYNPDAPLMHSVGIYVAFTGVFVHILQLVLRSMVDE